MVKKRFKVLFIYTNIFSFIRITLFCFLQTCCMDTWLAGLIEIQSNFAWVEPLDTGYTQLQIALTLIQSVLQFFSLKDQLQSKESLYSWFGKDNSEKLIYKQNLYFNYVIYQATTTPVILYFFGHFTFWNQLCRPMFPLSLPPHWKKGSINLLGDKIYHTSKHIPFFLSILFGLLRCETSYAHHKNYRCD